MLLYVLSIVAVITCLINFFVIFQKMWFSSNYLQVGKYAHLSGVHHSPFTFHFEFYFTGCRCSKEKWCPVSNRFWHWYRETKIRLKNLIQYVVQYKICFLLSCSRYNGQATLFSSLFSLRLDFPNLGLLGKVHFAIKQQNDHTFLLATFFFHFKSVKVNLI